MFLALSRKTQSHQDGHDLSDVLDMVPCKLNEGVTSHQRSQLGHALLQKTLLDVSTKDDAAQRGEEQFLEALLVWLVWVLLKEIRKHGITFGKHGNMADPKVSVDDFVDFVLLLCNFHVSTLHHLINSKKCNQHLELTANCS